MKRNNWNQLIALFCTVALISVQLKWDANEEIYFLAPTSSLADRPVQTGPILKPEFYGESSSTALRTQPKRRGSSAASRWILTGLMAVLGFPVVTAVSNANPVYAQDQNENLQGISARLKGLIRAGNKAEAISDIQRMGESGDVKYMNPLLGFLNSTGLDYNEHQDLYDVTIDALIQIFKANKGKTTLIHVLKQQRDGSFRDVYYRQMLTRVETVPELMVREILRRVKLHNNPAELQARQQERDRRSQAGDTEVDDYEDDLERYEGPIFRLYAKAVREGVADYDAELMGEVVTEVGRLAERGQSSGRRMFHGLSQALGDLPVDSANLQRMRSWLRTLESVAQRMGYWREKFQPNDREFIAQVFLRGSRERIESRLRREGLPLPEEPSVAREAEEETTPPAAETDVDKEPEDQIAWGSVLKWFLLIFVPVIGVIAAGVFFWKKHQADLWLRKTDLKRHPNLGRLLPERSEPFRAPKLTELPFFNIQTQPSQPLTQTASVGDFQLYPQSPGRAVVLHVPTKKQVPATQWGHFFLFEPSMKGNPGNRTVQALDVYLQQVVNLQEMGPFWVKGEPFQTFGELKVFRAWDSQNNREAALLELGDFLVQLGVSRADATQRNRIYRAVFRDLGDQGEVRSAQEIQLLETGNFLINIAPVDNGANRYVHWAWSWEDKEIRSIPHFQNYFLVKRLGAGGMGGVDLGWDPNAQRMVAIKRMHSDLLQDTELLTRFMREIKLTGQFDHPNIVPVHRSGIDPVMYYVMPVVDGTDLKELQEQLKEKGETIPFAEIVDIILQTAKGLKYAHDFEVDGEPANLVHRDLKPENLFVNRGGQVLVADFGMAQMDKDRLTQTGAVLGTPMYMSPEQAMGLKEETDKTSDMYALGVLLYKLTTGRDPFEEQKGQLIALLSRKAQQDKHDTYTPIRKLNPDVPPGLEDIARKAMAFNKEDRYQDMSELIADLKALKTDPSRRFDVKIQRSSKKKLQIGAAVGVVLTLLSSLGLSFLLTSRSKPDRKPVTPASSTTTPEMTFLTWDQLQVIVRREGIDKAIERIEREIRENATNREVGRSHYYRARLLIEQAAVARNAEQRQRLYQNAQEALDQALQRRPGLEKNPRFYYYRAIIKAGAGDTEGFNESIRLFLEKADGADVNFEPLKEQLEELRNRLNLWGDLGLVPMQIPFFDRTLPFELSV